MSEPVRILIVEDTPSDFELAQREIRKAISDCVFQQVETHDDFLRALDVFQPDLILSDYQMPRFDGLTALQLAQEHAKLTPFIIWTGTMGEDVAVELMRSGAINYILKENIKRLGPAVAHALEERRLLLEHKQAEETIRHNEKRFRTLIENGRDNISLLAVDGTLLWESPATIRSLGYAQDEFLGHNIFELMHPDDLQWISELYAKLIQEPGSRRDGDFRLRHRDGSWRWNEATVTNMLNEPGVNAIVANYRDITERKQAEVELHKSEERYRFLFENNPLPMWAYDLKTLAFLTVNDSAVEKYGYTREEFLRMTIADIRPMEEVSRLMEDVSKQRSPLQYAGEWRHRLKGGTIIDVEITSHTLQIDEHDAALVVAQDITERKRAKDQLNYHARLLRHISDAVIATDDQFHITAWNRAAEKMYGWSSEEVMGHNVSEILYFELTDEERSAARELVNESIASRSERTYRRRDGRTIYVEANTIALINQHGRMTGYVSVHRDITERKRADENILQLAAIVASSDDAIIGQSLEGRIVSWNPAAESLYGYSAAEIIGKPLSILFPPGQFDEAIRILERLRAGEHIAHFETVRVRKDSQQIHVSAAVSSIKDANGALIGTSAIERDISERKKAEEILRQSSLQEKGRRRLAVITELATIFALGLLAFILELNLSLFTQILTDFRVTYAQIDELVVMVIFLGLGTAVFSYRRWKVAEAEIIQRQGVQEALRTLHGELEMRVQERTADLAKTNIALTNEIAERELAEEVMRQSQADLETAEAQAHLGSWSFDPTTQNEGWSKEMFRLFGRDPALGTPSAAEFMELIHPEDRGRLAATQAHILEGGESSSDDYRTNPAQAPLRVLNASFRSEKDAEGKVLRVVGTALDITERKRAEEQTELQLQRLKALRAIDTAISSSFDLGLTLDILLDQVIAQLETDAAAILLFHPITRILEYGASRGFRSTAIREARVRLGEGYAGKAILERRLIHTLDLMGTDSEFSRALLLKGEGFNDYYCVPLIVKGEVKGVLEIFHRSVLAGGPDWLDFLETLAGQAAIAIQDAALFENLQDSNRELFQAYDATIEGWSHALDLRDKETEGHSLRVTEMTLELARKFGLVDEQLRHIRWGALLHDIGKMGVPDSILLKPDKLTDEEWERMKQHPVFAFEMLSPITYLKSSLDIPYCHHEKWDGTGYPRGLKGEVIPLAARLFAIVDVWDALCSDRPYRKAWSVEKTLEHIKSLSGTHFDPKVVEHFLEMVEQPNG